jgi:PIN domain nuclease of toxin-antitoxin system
MTFAGVADTHAALWYVFNDQRLSPAASRFIDAAVEKRQKVAVSAISLVELIYLIEKRRLPPSIYTDLRGALSDPDNALK